MFTSPAPAAPTPSASSASTSSTAPRSTGLRGGLGFLRNYTHSLHSHSAAAPASPRDDSRPPAPQTKTSARPRAATTTPSVPPSFAGQSAVSTDSAASSSALSRVQTAPDAESHLPSTQSRPPLPTPTNMTRTRADAAAPTLTVRNNSGPTPTSSSTSVASSMGAQAPQTDALNKHLPSIRFIPHQDPRAARPSLQFSTITRTLPDESYVIRVGRYSERDNIPEVPANIPSAAAVGFKSKVVSRKHCELWCKDGSWFIKDVKSSSGTFLNHIRLSQPNAESKPFRLKDGDIIQLGIDFRGGEEMIFRCVKIRIECNRGWQQALNTFNKQTHQRLRNLGKAKKEGDAASTHTSECSICLMSIAPCQSLFVAPCSHVWHYKCIRPILNGATWPNFLCPNCRAVADLEADVEDLGEFEVWDDDVAQANESDVNGEGTPDRHVTPKASTNALSLSDNNTQANGQISFDDLEAAISNINIADSLNGISSHPDAGPATPQRNSTPTSSSSTTQPVSINITGANEASGLSPLFPTATDNLGADRAPDCPMTPRNDAGPFVLDGSGSAGRVAGQRLRDGDSSNSVSTSAPTLPALHID